MKNLMQNIYWDAERNLEDMKKSNMTLTERIKYEKAMVQLRMLKTLIDKSEINLL